MNRHSQVKVSSQLTFDQQSIQARLVEENKTLAVERSHLSDLMANVQKMHNDLERSGENDRRRLESQLQLLENQA